MQKGKGLSEEALKITKERRCERQGKNEKVHPTEYRVPENSKERERFLNEQCREIEENNRMGKTKDLFKTRDIKKIFHERMSMIQDGNYKDLTEAEI